MDGEDDDRLDNVALERLAQLKGDYPPAVSTSSDEGDEPFIRPHVKRTISRRGAIGFNDAAYIMGSCETASLLDAMSSVTTTDIPEPSPRKRCRLARTSSRQVDRTSSSTSVLSTPTSPRSQYVDEASRLLAKCQMHDDEDADLPDEDEEEEEDDDSSLRDFPDDFRAQRRRRTDSWRSSTHPPSSSASVASSTTLEYLSGGSDHYSTSSEESS